MQQKYVYISMLTIFSIFVAVLMFWFNRDKKEVAKQNPTSFMDEVYVTRLETHFKKAVGGYKPQNDKYELGSNPVFSKILTGSGFENLQKAHYYDVKGDGNCGYTSILFSIFDLIQNSNSDAYKALIGNAGSSLEGFAQETFEREKQNVKKILESKREFSSLTRYEVIKLVIFLRLSIIVNLTDQKDLLIKDNHVDENTFYKCCNAIIHNMEDRLDGLVLGFISKLLGLKIVVLNFNYGSPLQITVVNTDSKQEMICLINFMNSVYLPVNIPESIKFDLNLSSKQSDLYDNHI